MVLRGEQSPLDSKKMSPKKDRRFTPIEALTEILRAQTQTLKEKIAQETRRQSAKKFAKKGFDGRYYDTEEGLRRANEEWQNMFYRKIPEAKIISKK